MKKIYYILLTVLITAFYSCNKDLLDTKPLDKFTGEAVWNDANLSAAFINNIYTDALTQYYSSVSDDWTDNVMLSEFGYAFNSMWNGDQLGPVIKTGVFDKSFDAGWNKYNIIRECDLAIDNLTGNKVILPSQTTVMIAEAKLLRAITYHWLVRRFGGVIIVDHALTPKDNLKLTRSSESDTYNFIIKDLEDAGKGLPAVVSQGRLSKYAAYGFLSRVLLDDGQYNLAIQYCDSVEQGNYVLDDYYNITKSFTSIINSPEIILSMARDATHCIFGDTYMQRFLPGISNASLDPSCLTLFTGQGLAGWLQLYPPQELVDAYLFNEGGNAVQHFGTEFVGKYPGLMWKNRDARFELTIVHDSTLFYNQLVTIREGGNCYHGSWPAVPSQQTASGYYFRKFIFEDQPQGYPTPINYALPLLRLGEIYLNKAEAYYRLGDLPNAILYTNKTRTRHGQLPPINSVTSDEFYTLYKIERRVELVYENDRYWSLLRWAKADNASSIPELTGQYHSLDIKKDGLVYIVPWFHITGSLTFDWPKRKYFPVPDAEILNNTNLTQNPNW